MKAKCVIVIMFMLTSSKYCFTENMLSLFKRAEISKSQIASCFENPIIEKNAISSKGEGYEIHIVTIGFIEEKFVQGWITIKDENKENSSENSIDDQISLQLNIERLISFYGFRYLSQIKDESPNNIGEMEDLWINNYWQLAIHPTEYGVEIFASTIGVWNDTLSKLENALSR